MKYFLFSLFFFLVVFSVCKKSSSHCGISLLSSKKIEKLETVNREKELKEKEKKEFFGGKDSLSADTLKIFEDKSLEHYEKKKEILSKDSLVARDFLENEEVLLLARKTLLNLEWVSLSFRKNQAYMRIFALDVIKEEARCKGTFVLIEVINELLRKWDKNKNYPGAAEDMVELIMALVEQEGREEIYKNPSYLFSSLNYDKKYKIIFSRALANLYPDALSNSKEVREIIKILEGLG